jgi:hypothetical protein
MGTFHGTRGNPKKEISNEDKQYLQDNYNELTLAQMAKHLHVSCYKVQCWLSEFGLQKKRVRAADKANVYSSEYFEHDRDLVTI